MGNEAPVGSTGTHVLVIEMFIHWFTRFEDAMQQIMATVSGAEITSIRLLTERLSYAEKHDALFSLLRRRSVPGEQIRQLQEHLRVVHTFAPLRDDFDAAGWSDGQMPWTTWPAWLPHAADNGAIPVPDVITTATAVMEDQDNPVSYTPEDMQTIVRRLAASYAGLRQYATAMGLLQPRPV
ncbi:MAG TPA: hypothetical protein VHO91_17180 [Rhodopila sp.]|nr:hypothetical protein [Rhodopila sp.]